MIHTYILPIWIDWLCAAVLVLCAVMFIILGDWYWLVAHLAMGRWLARIFGWSIAEYIATQRCREEDYCL